MNWRSVDQVLPGLPATITGAATISNNVTTNDPRFIVVTVRHAPGASGTLQLVDYNDADQADSSGVVMQSMALAAGDETVLRYNATTNGLLRNLIKIRVSGAAALSVTQVNCCVID